MSDIIETMKEAIQEALPDGVIEVQGSGGHFVIDVVSKEFAGKRIIQQHRLVLGAIAHLMKGDDAPVHAIDKLNCTVPAE